MQGDRSHGARFLPHGPFRVRVLLAMMRHHWFIRLRWMFAAGTVLLLIIERLQFPDFKRPYALAICVGALAVVNVIWTMISRHLTEDIGTEEPVSPGILRRVTLFVNAQMTVDLLALTAILRYSGGIENPMAVFYLFHVLIAALLLTGPNALLQGVWALMLYGGLATGECMGLVRPHYCFLSSTLECELHTHWMYVLSGIGVLAAGIFGTLFFTHQISSRLDDQERELHQANDGLRRSQVAIQDLQARRSRFMQTAAHQLKSPLAGIETLAGLIRDGVVNPDAVDALIGRIIERCQQAIHQVTELLTLARIQEAAPTRHHSAFTEVSRSVMKVAEWFVEQAKAKEINLKVEVGGCENAHAAVDAADLENCINNLIDNAIKYTSNGGSVWVTASCDPQAVFISVKDTGMGIAEGSEDDLFDPFRRGSLALANNIPGSGLGLAIVREVVEQAGGGIDVRSVVGEGSEFVLRFPKRGAAASTTTVRGTRAATLSDGEESTV